MDMVVAVAISRSSDGHGTGFVAIVGREYAMIMGVFGLPFRR